MRRLVILLAAVLITSSAAGQAIDKIQTKDGSVYNGFISEQEPGKHVLICAENASIIFKKKEMFNLRHDHYDYQRLSESSKQIVRIITDTTFLQLSSFDYDGDYFENLLVTDYMDSTVRAIALTQRTYIIPWKELVRTTRLSYNADPYGIRDVITLKSGERLIGQITEQEISKSMTLRTDDGLVRTIKVGDVLSIMSECISEDNSLWEQTPLLDRVVFQNGSMMEGFITSRLMGQHVNLLMKYSKDPQQIAMKDIRKYQKTRNRDFRSYAPDTARVVSLNDKEVALHALNEDNGVYVYKDTLVNTFFSGTDLKLSIKNIPYAKTAALYEYTPIKDESESRIKSKKNKGERFIIAVDAHPIYETPFIENDGFMTCDVVVRKPGKYFLTINGFASGINLVFINKSENEE